MDRIEAANELAFRVGFTGHSGHLRVEPISTVERSDPVKSLPDFILVSVPSHDILQKLLAV
jgi:antiviral helicase SKI2